VIAATLFVDPAELPVVAKPRGETRVFHARIRKELISAEVPPISPVTNH
jgi:hypothetical protein